MCEFCNVPNSNSNRDAFHSDFAGFFSADAIEAAVKQVNASHPQQSQQDDDSAESDDDSDGT
jgi:hypothetical protein